MKRFTHPSERELGGGPQRRPGRYIATGQRCGCFSSSDAQTSTQSNPKVATDNATLQDVKVDHGGQAATAAGAVAVGGNVDVNTGFKLGNVSGGITVTNSGDPALTKALTSTVDSLAKQQADVLKSLASGIGNSGNSGGSTTPPPRTTTTPLAGTSTPLTPEEEAAKEKRNKLLLGGGLLAAIVFLSR